MNIVMETRFGSHLYGTDTAASDLDIKSVFIPPARNILLQRTKSVINIKTKSDNAVKNTAEDVDREVFALHRFLELAAQGKTVAMDVLFATEEHFTSPPTETWTAIRLNRHRLLSRQAKSFIGYVRQQANKYGIKGSRMAAARAVVSALENALDSLPGSRKFGELGDALEATFAGLEHVEFIDKPNPGGVIIRHLSVCNRLAPYTQSLKETHAVFSRLLAEYGQRSAAAERNENIDWKALSHAVRVGRQAIELLGTGHVTFPRPERAHLLAIKTGRLAYSPVAEEIESLLDEVQDAAERSTLPEVPDYAWIDDFVAETYAAEIRCPSI